MDSTFRYDVAVIGGGLAGLAVSIQFGAKGYKVALFEKEQYPFHKVCGEYISIESWNFLKSLGLPLSSLNLPVIKKLIVTSPDGNELQVDLPLGGFGISRYFLDNELKKIALINNVAVYEKCKVNEVIFKDEQFYVHTNQGDFFSKLCCGSFGKRSNLDIKWKRNFTLKRNNKLNNYIGVKYHVKTNLPADTIALHNFKNGYCGISKVEDDIYCLCYLTNADNLIHSNNSVEQMEINILEQNKHLKMIFENSEKLFDAPVTISQISFNAKEQVYNHILLFGDAAGMITPLCGNGMSIALHGSKIAFKFMNEFLQGKINRATMETEYRWQWKMIFNRRIVTGRIVQSLFGKIWLTNFFVRCMKKLPTVTRKIISLTHGKSF